MRGALALFAGAGLVAEEAGKLLQVARLGDAPGRHGDRLGAAGDDGLRIAQRYGAHGGEDGVETGAALAVDGCRRRRLRQPGRQRDEPCRIASLRGISDDQLVDLPGLETAILQCNTDERRAQLLDAPVAMQATDATDSGSPGRDDVRGLRRHMCCLWLSKIDTRESDVVAPTTRAPAPDFHCPVAASNHMMVAEKGWLTS